MANNKNTMNQIKNEEMSAMPIKSITGQLVSLDERSVTIIDEKKKKIYLEFREGKKLVLPNIKINSYLDRVEVTID